MFSHDIQTSIDISADAERLWQLLTDFERYATWNPMLADVHTRLGKHAQVHFKVLREELSASSPQVWVKSLDVADFESVAPVLRACAEELGGLDVVIVNAGVAFSAPIGQGYFESMRQTIDVNLTGAIATSEAAVELFREQGRGQLVGISSIAALRGMRNQGAYCATKAAFGKYLEPLRCETPGESLGVTELAPGYIDTDLNRSLARCPSATGSAWKSAGGLPCRTWVPTAWPRRRNAPSVTPCEKHGS